MKQTILALAIVCFLSSCGAKVKSDPVVYILDKDSNSVVSKYYLDASDNVKKTETYGNDKLISRVREFEYEDGYVRSMKETNVGKADRALEWTTTVEKDEQGRIISINRSCSTDGSSVKTVFGYDENGTLRASGITTTTKDGAKSVVMRDYPNE